MRFLRIKIELPRDFSFDGITLRDKIAHRIMTGEESIFRIIKMRKCRV